MMDLTRDLERIADYLADRLPAEEQRAFDERLVREPELVRELELTLQLRDGLHQLRARGLVALPARTTGRRHAWLPALAAAAVLVVVALGLQVYSGLQRSIVPGTSLLTTSKAVQSGSAAEFTLIPTRGATPILPLPSTGRIDFGIAVESSDDAAGYQVALFGGASGSSTKPLATLSGVVPAPDGYLHIQADASRLQPGHFVLLIQPRAPGLPAERFPFTFGPRNVSPAK